MSSRRALIDVALGNEPAELAITNGRVVNVHTREIYSAGVAIKGDRIAAVGDIDYAIGENTEVIDAENRYVTPGLIDGHPQSPIRLLNEKRVFLRDIPRQQSLADWNDFWSEYKTA